MSHESYLDTKEWISKLKKPNNWSVQKFLASIKQINNLFQYISTPEGEEEQTHNYSDSELKIILKKSDPKNWDNEQVKANYKPATLEEQDIYYECIRSIGPNENNGNMTNNNSNHHHNYHRIERYENRNNNRNNKNKNNGSENRTDKSNQFNINKNNGSGNIGNNNNNNYANTYDAPQCQTINSAKDEYKERKRNRSPGNQSTGQNNNGRRIFLRIIVEVVLVMITTEAGLTVPVLIVVRKVPILVNLLIMEITMITP